MVLSFSPIARDPRVDRQVSALLDAGHAVTVIGEGPAAPSGASFIAVTPLWGESKVRKGLRAGLMLFGLRRLAYWSYRGVREAHSVMRTGDADLYLANDIEALPAALRAAGAKPVVVDLHEHVPSDWEYSWTRRLTTGRFRLWLCRRYLRRATAASTVGDGIADAYAAEFPIGRPSVIRNVPFREELHATEVADDRLSLVYHGVAGPGRGLEILVESSSLWRPGVTLHLMLVEGLAGFLADLTDRVRGSANVVVIPPVKTRDIAKRINEFDVGIFISTARGEQGRFSMPNKVFEYIQARLCVLVGNSPEIGGLVEEFGCGRQLPPAVSPHELAYFINGLSPHEVREMKRAAGAAADTECWEVERERFLKLISDALAG
jgi:hypothetical protein